MSKYILQAPPKDMSWEEFLAKSTDWLDGFSAGYDKCASDRRIYELSRYPRKQQTLEKDILKVLDKITKSKHKKESNAFSLLLAIHLTDLGYKKGRLPKSDFVQADTE
jgi:hypothetical protein